jgi:colicin import membrane protein
MRDRQIYSSFYYSLGLHSFLLITIVAYILISGSSHKLSSITVSLVQSSVRGSSAASVTPQTKQPEPVEEESKPTLTSKAEPKATTAKDRIAALQAKKQVVKSAAQRRQLDISRSSAKVAGGGTPGGGSYEEVVGTIIQKNWANADFLNKYRSLRAIIAIRIARSGEVTILAWERKSGSALFDREALRAITNSSPLPPPPTEMEIGINFDPQKGK